MHDTQTIIDALECYRLKCTGEIRCACEDCPFFSRFEGSLSGAYCMYNHLLFSAIQKLRAQKEQIEALHKGIEQLRDAFEEEARKHGKESKWRMTNARQI